MSGVTIGYSMRAFTNIVRSTPINPGEVEALSRAPVASKDGHAWEIQWWKYRAPLQSPPTLLENWDDWLKRQGRF